jgi:hypothetical protein
MEVDRLLGHRPKLAVARCVTRRHSRVIGNRIRLVNGRAAAMAR